ncbi:hypothetical protein VTG60DRAFT_6549 [Thermothelomyces hinnuleus]
MSAPGVAVSGAHDCDSAVPSVDPETSSSDVNRTFGSGCPRLDEPQEQEVETRMLDILEVQMVKKQEERVRVGPSAGRDEIQNPAGRDGINGD